LDLSENKIVELTPIKCPKLMRLDLSDNRLEKGDSFDGHPRLQWLNFKKNRFNTTAFIKDMPELVELYLVSRVIFYNKIRTKIKSRPLVDLKIWEN
jgi:Leucine-rich repeat (LRR) protein